MVQEYYAKIVKLIHIPPIINIAIMIWGIKNV